MRVLVCGGREYNDADKVFHTLSQIHVNQEISLLISGGCPNRTKPSGVLVWSADRLGEKWAEDNEVDTLIRRAKWRKFALAAGPKRNGVMAHDKPDKVIAFPGGKGTADMVRKAKAAGIEVREIE